MRYTFILTYNTRLVDAFKYAFLPRTIPAWNSLPPVVAEAD